MAKIYAEMNSDKGGRVASKGGNESITVTFRNGNINIFDVTFTPDEYRRGQIKVMSYNDASEKIIGYCES